MPKTRWIFAAAGLLLCGGSSALAAGSNSLFTVDVFKTAQGLPSSAVLAVTQTRDGYLWVGTQAGLARFDGVQFEVFDENNTPGLNSSEIIRLYEDRQTNLWVGAENGGINLVKDGKVTSVDLGRGGSGGRLMAICEDRGEDVMFYTDAGLLGPYRDGKAEVCYTNSDAPSTCRAITRAALSAYGRAKTNYQSVYIGGGWRAPVADHGTRYQPDCYCVVSPPG